MESVSEESLLKETEIVASPPANFGELLRSRREAAELSVADLARKTGVVRTTIHNIEQGLTSASPQTLKLLASVKSLRLTELDNSRDGSLEAWFTEQYNPMQMVRGMGAVLNGPGGQIEQTLLVPRSAERVRTGTRSATVNSTSRRFDRKSRSTSWQSASSKRARV
jgi:transcriptional regulator with XRE-family HTH domain